MCYILKGLSSYHFSTFFFYAFQVQSDDEVIQETPVAEPAAVVEAGEEREPAVTPAAPSELTTPKSQQHAVPKLKTPLQPTKVASELEGEENNREQKAEETMAEVTEQTEVGHQQPEVTIESGQEVVKPEVAEPETESTEPELEVEDDGKEKPSLRYSQLSEEEERLRTYSEISEASDDRVKFVIGETESESGSHLDLKG